MREIYEIFFIEILKETDLHQLRHYCRIECASEMIDTKEKILYAIAYFTI